MLYHKYELDNRTTVINELYDDEIIAFCGGCDKEMEVTLKDIAEIEENGADMVGTTFYCKECTKEKNMKNLKGEK